MIEFTLMIAFAAAVAPAAIARPAYDVEMSIDIDGREVRAGAPAIARVTLRNAGQGSTVVFQ